jgi:hypothetical protein
MLDTKVGAEEKDDPAKVAQDGFKAMIAGEAGVVSGWQNKLQVATAHVMPAKKLAKKHASVAAPERRTNSSAVRLTHEPSR